MSGEQFWINVKFWAHASCETARVLRKHTSFKYMWVLNWARIISESVWVLCLCSKLEWASGPYEICTQTSRDLTGSSWHLTVVSSEPMASSEPLLVVIAANSCMDCGLEWAHTSTAAVKPSLSWLRWGGQQRVQVRGNFIMNLWAASTLPRHGERWSSVYVRLWLSTAYPRHFCTWKRYTTLAIAVGTFSSRWSMNAEYEVTRPPYTYISASFSLQNERKV